MPAYAFHVEIISGSEYMSRYLDAKNEDINDKNGWDWFGQKGCSAYDFNTNILIGFPYPKDTELPLIRAIVHELGHYKQHMQYGVTLPDKACENDILEYHNIMVNENTVHSQEKDNDRNDVWYKGYRVNYCLQYIKDVPKGLFMSIGYASTNISNLLRNNYSATTKLLLNRMLEIAEGIETVCKNDVDKINILNLLVYNMCLDIKRDNTRPQ